MKLTSGTGRISWVVDLGLMAYASACDLQRAIVQARRAGAVPDVLLLCEHPHVITLGRNGRPEHLHVGNHVLGKMNVAFHSTDRGGDITYHGPGQIVGYPILDLAEHRRDVRWYVRQLEELMIRATARFGIIGKRLEGAHGVWIDAPAGVEKLAALGVHLNRWVTSHGFAYNVSTDLHYFDLIVPCGIPDRRVTSLERLLGRAVSSKKVAAHLVEHFGEVFERTIVPVSRGDLGKAVGGNPARTQVACEAAAESALAPEETL